MITTFVSVLLYEEPWILTVNASMHIWINRWSDKGTDYDSLFSWMDISSASPDVQTRKQTKHWLHNVLHAVPYGQHGKYFSLTGQYQHVFPSDRTVDSTAIMDVWGIMCPLNKFYHFQALFVQHSQLDQPYIPTYFVHNQYILNSMNSTIKPLYLLQIYYLPCSPYMATLKWPLPNCCHYAYNILNKMPIFQTYNFTHFHCYRARLW